MGKGPQRDAGDKESVFNIKDISLKSSESPCVEVTIFSWKNFSWKNLCPRQTLSAIRVYFCSVTELTRGHPVITDSSSIPCQ